MKNLINKIKEEIKEQAIEQRSVKNQRKTNRLVGERTMSAYDAAELARKNKHSLSIKYASYYILKHGLEEPVYEDKLIGGNLTRKVCINLDKIKENLSKCFDEKCYLFERLGSWYGLECEISECIQTWKDKYMEKEH